MFSIAITLIVLAVFLIIVSIVTPIGTGTVLLISFFLMVVGVVLYRKRKRI
ncbi:hypothetical protein LCL95_01250 [Bacillus timonensis]|nr:hypothetical protein [Bacillus timonensis]